MIYLITGSLSGSEFNIGPYSVSSNQHLDSCIQIDNDNILLTYMKYAEDSYVTWGKKTI